MDRLSNDSALVLGIEGGATRTVALLANAADRPLIRVEAGPGNLRLLTDAQLVSLFRQVRTGTASPAVLAIGLAGARTEADRQRIRMAASQVWPLTPCYATNDLETGLAAAQLGKPARARILVLCGTGSCCYGQAANGREAKVGGWGHHLGDRGSAYEIGLRSLQAVVAAYDATGRWPALGRRLLAALHLHQPEDFIQWAQSAPKNEMAALATVAFAAAQVRDVLAAKVLGEAAERLAADAASCARRLAAPGQRVAFFLAGGVLLKQPSFARKVVREILRRWPKAEIAPLRREGAWGAVALARQMIPPVPNLKLQTSNFNTPLAAVRASRSPDHGTRITNHGSRATRNVQRLTFNVQRSTPDPALAALPASPTEQRNPRSMNLDRMPIGDAIDLMLSEDAKIPRAILAQRPALEWALRQIIRAFRRGGRLFYVGAGTSGRLGVLDASECPPTFRTPPNQVQGIIAGGPTALAHSVEGAEDDAEAGAAALRFRGVTHRDVVVGIAASGRTPFVWGALWEAKHRRAFTILLTFNPHLPIPPADRPHLIIAPNVGPEILTGSTRLKAGTATKLILNLFTTLAMVKLGKVVSNLMVDLNPSNTKLRDRAVRILCQLTGTEPQAAQAALEHSHWVVNRAWRWLSGRLRKSRQAK